MKLKFNLFIFISISLITTFLAIIFPFVLPERFFYDANLIVNDPNNEIGFIGSYPLTMLFYKITILKYLPYSIVGLIQLPILFFLLYKIGVPKKIYVINTKNVIVYVSFLLIGIFICQPSKEFITFLYTWWIVYYFTKNDIPIIKRTIFLIISFIIFSILYRPYFIFIPFVAIVIFIINKTNIQHKVFKSLFFGILTIIFISLSYGVVKGKYFSQQTREDINDIRGSIDANSMIESPIEPNVWYGEIISVFYGFFSVNIPINGITHFLKPQILAFIIWQLILFYILFKRFKYLIKNKETYYSEYWLMIGLFSYFIIQGVFEPDLGSAVRHKIGIFPLIYYLLYYEDFRKKI